MKDKDNEHEYGKYFGLEDLPIKPQVFEWARNWGLERFKASYTEQFDHLVNEVRNGKINHLPWRYAGKRIMVSMKKYLRIKCDRETYKIVFSNKKSLVYKKVKKSLTIASRFSLVHSLGIETCKGDGYVYTCLPLQSREFIRVIVLINNGLPISHFGFKIKPIGKGKVEIALACYCDDLNLDVSLIERIAQDVYLCCKDHKISNKAYRIQREKYDGDTSSFCASVAPNRISVTSIDHKSMNALSKKIIAEEFEGYNMDNLLQHIHYSDSGFDELHEKPIIVNY